jgi:hypothetical protein
MYQDVKQWREIRDRVLVDKCSKRQVVRDAGVSWGTLEKMLAYPFPPKHKREASVYSQTPAHRTRKYASDQEHTWHEVLDLLATANRDDTQTIIAAIASINPWQATSHDLTTLRTKLRNIGFGSKTTCHCCSRDWEPHQWMLRVMQKAESLSTIRDAVGDAYGLDILVEKARNGTLKERNRAFAVLTRLRHISLRVTERFLHSGSNAILKHWKTYSQDGVQRLFQRYRTLRPRKAEVEEIKQAVFSMLHSPPSAFNINRTTWTMKDLKTCLATKGIVLTRDTLREITGAAGYTWRKAKIVLTSNDPEYREKLEKIQKILSNLGKDERLFSIDEFGPFAVKMKGGRRLVGPGEYPSVPQFQKSKGCLILTGALELSQNQVTHFYSKKKNTEEMIRLLYVLLKQYKGCGKLYLSWDAASWHASNLLNETVDKLNSQSYRAEHGTPLVELAPLPASAQFLNVIESVFSGMARAIIHNSDYSSVEEAMAAIDRYFAERNEHFRQHPKRAGKKIWGKELVLQR